MTRLAHLEAVPLTWIFVLERVTGIEPALSAWEADVLPLNYTRASAARPVAAATADCAVFAQTSYRTGWAASVVQSDRGITTKIEFRAGTLDPSEAHRSDRGHPPSSRTTAGPGRLYLAVP